MKHLTILLMLCLGWLTACQSSLPSPVEAYPYQRFADGAWGLMSRQGDVLVPAGTFGHQPTAVVNGRFAVPDSAGFLVLHGLEQPTLPLSPRRFTRIGYFFEPTTPAQEQPYGPILLIDRQGHTCFSSDTDSPYPLAYLHNFSEGRALAITTQGKYGYLDTQGRWVIPPLYARAYDFHQGMALVGIEDAEGRMGYQLIDSNGKQVAPIQQNQVWLDHGFHEDLLLMKHLHTQQFCYLNTEGKDAFYLPLEIKEATAFQYGMAAVQTSQGWGVIDRQGQFLLPPRFEKIYRWSSHEIWVSQKGRWALYTTEGKALTAFDFDSPQEYLAQTWNVAHVEVDSQALQLIPQAFYKQPVAPSTLLKSTATQQSVAAKASTPTRQATSHQPTRPQTAEKTLQLPEQDWQRVSQQNPFYAEAQKVLSGKLKEDDAKRRRLILNYVEHFRTAYTTKDIDFLEQVFSEQALIIVGKVIRSAQQPEGQFLTPQQVVYQVKSKRQYLDRLRQVFQGNREIKLTFSNFQIMRHPTHPHVYGVSLRQGYASDLYTDDGYLFLLWDFSDETTPKIHVRTWQPSMLNEHTPLPQEAILNIRHFNLK